MPAASSAFRIESRVRSLRGSPRSSREIVSVEAFAARASSRTPHPKAARAILDWTGEIRDIDTIYVACRTEKSIVTLL
jgi:hypothetical protein